MPSDLVPPLLPVIRTQALEDVLLGVEETHPGIDMTTLGVFEMLEELYALSAAIESEWIIQGDDLWTDELFLGLRVNPIAHRLLDAVPNIHGAPQDYSIITAIGLGAILFIIAVKQKSSAYPGSLTASYWSTLLDLIGNMSADPATPMVPALSSLTLWLLVLYAMTVPAPDDQDPAIRLIARSMWEHDIWSWDIVMQKVRSMPWISGFEKSCARLAANFG